MSGDGGEAADQGGVVPFGQLGHEDDRDESLGHVAEEGDGAEPFAQDAQGVGRADVAAAVPSDIDAAEPQAEPQSRGDGAEGVSEQDGGDGRDHGFGFPSRNSMRMGTPSKPYSSRRRFSIYRK